MGELEDELDDAQGAVDDADSAAKNVGEGKQDVDKAEQDATDGDQDSADKASNVTNDGADALRDGGEALDALGIDNPLSDVADDMGEFADDAFGKKHPPDSLPPLRYRLFFGKQDSLEAGLENMLDDGLGVADSLLEAGAGALGVSEYLGTDPFSSVMEKHSPFAEDPVELDAAESIWRVAHVRCDEGLNRLWRCEILLVTDETRNSQLEDDNDAASAAGGLIDQVAGPIKSAIGAVEELAGVFSDDPSAPAPKSPAAKRIAGIKDAAGRLSSASSVGDVVGALSDIVYGAEPAATPDARVFINIPLDPVNFLGQTVSLRVSREFTAPAPSADSNDVPGHSFSARYLTGIVVEMDDLGTRTTKLDAGLGSTEIRQRHIRVVLMPELFRLSLRRDHRVFNELTAIAIVREVIRAAGIYGFLPDLPGVGAATSALGELASMNPFGGGAMADALSGQFIKLMPPPSKNADVAQASGKQSIDEWTNEREMCVQYGETDLDFVRRLLEEEGIHFTFTCRRGFERLVLVHDPSELDQAPTVDGRPVPFTWPHWTSTPAVETIDDAREWRKTRPSTITLRDFSYSMADQRATQLVAPPGAPLGNLPEAMATYAERYQYPGNYPFQYIGAELVLGTDAIHYRAYGSHDDDRDLAQLRLEEEASESRRVRLTTDLIGASCDTTLRMRGFVFDRNGAPQPVGDDPPPADRIVVERVRWSGSMADPQLAVTGPNFALPPNADYQNEITGWWLDVATPGASPVRPRRVTPKPRVTSFTTATVVDWTGDHDEEEEIEHEDPTTVRVRVRFHWDRRGELPLGIIPPIGIISQRGASCWCRVAQAWAGDDFGVLFVPRVGSEVVIAFEHGDPDRPVIVGSLYDGEHPVPLPGREVKREGFEPPKAEHTELSTIATRTTPWDEDDGVGSELTFDDTAKKERVFLKAGRHLIEEVRGEHKTLVGLLPDQGVQTNEVGGDHGEIIEKRQQLHIDGNREKTVGRSQIETIRGTRDVRVIGDQKTLVTLSNEETIDGRVELIGKGDRELFVHGERATEVGKEGDEKPAHDIHDITGKKDCIIVGNLKVRAKSIAIGEPAEGEFAPDSTLESGPEKGAEGEEDGPPGLHAKSQLGYKLIADKEVRIISNEGSVELIASERLSAMVGNAMLEMGKHADGGVLAWHSKKVAIHTVKGVVLADTEEVRLKAVGEADALAIVSTSQVRLSGRTGVVDANREIRDASDTQSHG